jgi:glycosyltransferase involved in cell wall biosynthesis
MRIAMLGSKGIPSATSKGGGVETHVEKLSVRLVERGHQVMVYARPYANPDKKKSWNGVQLITLPTIQTKNLDAIISTLFATIHVLFQDVDIIHYHGVGPSTLAWIPRLLKPRAKVVVTFHSRDRFHEKWGMIARAYLAFGEWTAVTFPHATIAVSHVIKVFCQRMYNAHHVLYIPNGVEIAAESYRTDALKKFDLKPNGYFYSLCRFIPHKAVEDIIEAFKGVETDKKLLIIGWAAESEREYGEKIAKATKGDPRIILAGRQTGETLEQLMSHAYAMVTASRFEGLSIAVLEAMSHGKMAVMSDIPENLEVVDHSGVAFKTGDIGALRETLQWLCGDEILVRERGERARDVIKKLYSWDSVVIRIEHVYNTLLNK